MRQAKLSPAEVTELSDAAKTAWNGASPSAKKVMFTWKGYEYQSRNTTFSMLVETPGGIPVAKRHH
jgi:hypothetical protein